MRLLDNLNMKLTLASADYEAISRAAHAAPDHMTALRLSSISLDLPSFDDIEHDDFVRC